MKEPSEHEPVWTGLLSEHSVEEYTVIIYSDIDDWIGLLSDADKFKESRNDPEKKVHSFHISPMYENGRDK